MRRWPAPALLAVPLVAAACGGGGGSSSSPPPTVSNLSPVAYVKGAAVKTAEATSEHVTVKGLAQVSGQTVTLDGSGDFDQQSRVGSISVFGTVFGCACLILRPLCQRARIGHKVL